MDELLPCEVYDWINSARRHKLCDHRHHAIILSHHHPRFIIIKRSRLQHSASCHVGTGARIGGWSNRRSHRSTHKLAGRTAASAKREARSTGTSESTTTRRCAGAVGSDDGGTASQQRVALSNGTATAANNEPGAIAGDGDGGTTSGATAGGAQQTGLRQAANSEPGAIAGAAARATSKRPWASSTRQTLCRHLPLSRNEQPRRTPARRKKAKLCRHLPLSRRAEDGADRRQQGRTRGSDTRRRYQEEEPLKQNNSGSKASQHS